jgi:hypothetical protein
MDDVSAGVYLANKTENKSKWGNPRLTYHLDIHGHLMKDVNSEAPMRPEKAVFDKKWRQRGDID